MKEIRETLSANNTIITNSIKEAISSVQSGIEQKITDLSEKIEGQMSEFIGFREEMTALKRRVVELERKDKDARVNELSKAMEEEVLWELRKEEMRLVVIGYEFEENDSS